MSNKEQPGYPTAVGAAPSIRTGDRPPKPGEETMWRVRVRRERLRRVMDRLEAAIAAPAPGREAPWIEEVREAVEETVAAVNEHATETEAADGLFAQVLADAPRLAGKIRRLEAEHAELADAARALRERLGPTTGGVPLVKTIREDALHLLGCLARHRHLGADLLYEAYVVDVGAID